MQIVCSEVRADSQNSNPGTFSVGSTGNCSSVANIEAFPPTSLRAAIEGEGLRLDWVPTAFTGTSGSYAQACTFEGYVVHMFDASIGSWQTTVQGCERTVLSLATNTKLDLTPS